MEKNNKKEKIKAAVAISIILIIIIMSVIISIIYQIEGEKNMPFILSKLTIISTAEGIASQENAEEKWNLQISQNNDIYFNFTKNEKYEEEEFIKSIIIDNIEVTKQPEIGEIKIYMPNSSEGRTFIYSEELQVENSLEYKGATKSNTKTLQIGNQGGNIAIRIANTNFAKYISNDDEEVKHDGTIISKTDVKKEQLEFSISMDVVINTKTRSYKTTINLDFPCGNIIEEGTCNIEKTNQKEFIFKRI